MESDSSPLGGQLRVLLISPSMEMRSLLRSALQQEPLLDSQLTECESLADAQSRLTAYEIDLAILDTSLEDVRWLSENSPDTAIVYFSETSPDLLHDSVDAGATDFFCRSEFNGNAGLLWSSLRQTIRYHAIRLRHRHLSRIVNERGKQIVRLTQRLWRTSPFDHRTGWFSHAQIVDRCQEEIGRAIRYSLPLSLALVDIPCLGRCDEEKGPDALGEMLIELSGRIRLISRHSDIVGHYGIESFLVVLTNTDEEGARSFCHRLRQALNPPIVIGNESHTLEWYVALVSRGPEGSSTPTDLLNALEHRIDRARNTSISGTVIDSDTP